MENSMLKNTERFVNVGKNERIISGISGAVLLLSGVAKPSLFRGMLAALGGYMIYRGVSGHCVVYRYLNINRTGGQSDGILVERAVTINRPAAEVYQFWRDLENLPRFMEHLESVRVSDSRRSHWTAKAPLGQSVEWDAEITAEEENRRISWHSLPGSTIENSGSVIFKPAPGDRGTEVYVRMEYHPPFGSAGAEVAKLLGEEPDRQIMEDLRRFKQIIETGEITTVQDQPAGKRPMVQGIRSWLQQ